jgi:hypothetical protein
LTFLKRLEAAETFDGPDNPATVRGAAAAAAREIETSSSEVFGVDASWEDFFEPKRKIFFSELHQLVRETSARKGCRGPVCLKRGLFFFRLPMLDDRLFAETRLSGRKNAFSTPNGSLQEGRNRRLADSFREKRPAGRRAFAPPDAVNEVRRL